MESLLILLFVSAPISIPLLMFFSITTSGVLIKVTLKTFMGHPMETLKAIVFSIAWGIFGYLKDGLISIDIALYGVVGFLIYLLFLLVKMKNIDL